jgi:hypothetical protein
MEKGKKVKIEWHPFTQAAAGTLSLFFYVPLRLFAVINLSYAQGWDNRSAECGKIHVV